MVAAPVLREIVEAERRTRQQKAVRSRAMMLVLSLSLFLGLAVKWKSRSPRLVRVPLLLVPLASPAR